MESDKNNTNAKCRFFAQYWGQEILGSTHFNNTKSVMFNYDLFGSLNTSKGLIGAIEAFKTYFLKLKPLSQITREDAEYIIDSDPSIDSFLSFINDLEKGHCNKFQVVDDLRKKGYAVPFMGYSVEDLVSFGWVRLDQPKTICFDCGKKDSKEVEEKVVTARLAICDICKQKKLTANSRHYE